MYQPAWEEDRRILVVEDDPDLRETLGTLLRNEGYDVIDVENGAKALECMRSGATPALILLDLMMPVMDGWQFRVEQKRDPALASTPVVVMSSDDSPKAVAVDADLYLRKPFDFTELVENIEKILRKEQSRKMAQAERLAALGTLAAGLTHEINNPLAYVIANLNYLRQHVPQLVAPGRLEEVAPPLDEAIEGAERIRGVVQRVRSFSAPEEERRDPVDVRGVLESSINIAFNEIRHRARLVRDYEPTPPVLANEGSMGQVFLNLLINAAQSIQEGDAARNMVRVSTRVDDAGRVVVSISDTGHGIRPELRERIFEPFFTTKPQGSGTGLGLSICYGIVKSWGGEIEVDSDVGEGTTFRVILPAAEAKSKEIHKTEAPPPDERIRGRILVIDDEPALARALKRVLTNEHDVVTVTSGQDALEILANDDAFDLVLCDLMMPEMSGMDFFEQIKADHPALEERVIFMTGGAFTPRARDFLSHVTSPYLSKPVDTKHLRELLVRRLSMRPPTVQ